MAIHPQLPAGVLPTGVPAPWNDPRSKGSTGCGLEDVWAETPANVVVNGGRDIEYASCTFAHLGAAGASAVGGAQDVAWRNCSFYDTSAAALVLGSVDTLNVTDPGKWDRNFTVADSTITSNGIEYTAAAGIFVGYASEVVIEHNWIHDTSYSNIAMGWGWGREGSGRGRNHVVGNKLENPNMVRCCDGGAVYTLGPQPGSDITGNYVTNTKIHPTTRMKAPTAFYFDSGSGGFEVKSNAIDGFFSFPCGVNPSAGAYGFITRTNPFDPGHQAGGKCPGACTPPPAVLQAVFNQHVYCASTAPDACSLLFCEQKKWYHSAVQWFVCPAGFRAALLCVSLPIVY